MASIRDVAKEAGVAICTVSRLINGTANVEPETQKKIEDAMKKLDYVPNELARGMFKGRSNSIAMLVPNIQHPWFSSLASEIEKILYEKKYKFMLFSTSDDKQREKECFKLLKSNIVDGIICGTSGESTSVDVASTLKRRPQYVGKVTAKELNVRSWADVESPVIKKWPLLREGNLVDICDTIKASDGSEWYYVRIAGKYYGFVATKYIKRQ